MDSFNLSFQPDILGNGFEVAKMELQDDYEGKVIASLIRKTMPDTNKAILYIHGYNDYFFLSELGDYCWNYNYNLYALDLRKYGRSLLAHQKQFNMRSVTEYYEEIDKAISFIKEHSINDIVLCGHSTGGLIASLYMHEKQDDRVSMLVLSSPFFDINTNWLLKLMGVPLLSFIGRFFPNLNKDPDLSRHYASSIHISEKGEWDYNLYWKPPVPPPVTTGWIHGIYKAQKEVKSGLNIQVPILVLHSDKSSGGRKWNDLFMRSDIVLRVEPMKRYSLRLGNHVHLYEIKDALHDVFLSRSEVRDEAYKTLFDALKQQLG